VDNPALDLFDGHLRSALSRITNTSLSDYTVVAGQFAHKTRWPGYPSGAFAGTSSLFGFSREHLGSPVADFVGISLYR